MPFKYILFLFSFIILCNSCVVKKQTNIAFGGVWNAKIISKPTDSALAKKQIILDSTVYENAKLVQVAEHNHGKKSWHKLGIKKAYKSVNQVKQSKDPEPKKYPEQNEMEPFALFGLLLSILGLFAAVFSIVSEIYFIFFFEYTILIAIFITLIALVFCIISLVKFYNKTNKKKKGIIAAWVGFIISGLLITSIFTLLSLLFSFD